MHWLRTALTGGSDSPLDAQRVTALEQHVKALYDHAAEHRTDVRRLEHELQQLRQDEARRAAEHATMVDQLSRLYKRVSARISREADSHPSAAAAEAEESVMALRKRLGR